MLWQFHHQYKDGHTVKIDQRDVNSFDEMREWIKELNEFFPLPEGTQWLACNKNSEHFEWIPGSTMIMPDVKIYPGITKDPDAFRRIIGDSLCR